MFTYKYSKFVHAENNPSGRVLMAFEDKSLHKYQSKRQGEKTKVTAWEVIMSLPPGGFLRLWYLNHAKISIPENFVLLQLFGPWPHSSR